MRINTNTVCIDEQDRNWLVRWDATSFEEHDTAAEALSAVRQRDALLAESGISIFTTVEWNTYTNVGRMVVRALQS